MSVFMQAFRDNDGSEVADLITYRSAHIGLTHDRTMDDVVEYLKRLDPAETDDAVDNARIIVDLLKDFGEAGMLRRVQSRTYRAHDAVKQLIAEARS